MHFSRGVFVYLAYLQSKVEGNFDEEVRVSNHVCSWPKSPTWAWTSSLLRYRNDIQKDTLQTVGLFWTKDRPDRR